MGFWGRRGSGACGGPLGVDGVSSKDHSVDVVAKEEADELAQLLLDFVGFADVGPVGRGAPGLEVQVLLEFGHFLADLFDVRGVALFGLARLAAQTFWRAARISSSLVVLGPVIGSPFSGSRFNVPVP
jgi:hypothetical protein